MFVVFDLDGTLRDPSHRQHLLSTGDWDAFYAACGDDTPIWHGLDTLRAHLHHGHRVEIWTGCRGTAYHITRDWLHAHGVPSTAVPMLMRGAADTRPDVEIKGEWLREYTDRNDRPDLVYEDRDRVVAMWREAGIPCYQVAPGDF